MHHIPGLVLSVTWGELLHDPSPTAIYHLVPFPETTYTHLEIGNTGCAPPSILCQLDPKRVYPGTMS